MAPLAAGIAPATDAEGAAVQAALARLVGAVPPAGFKIGATGSRMQAYLGIDRPVAGFMRAAGRASRPGRRCGSPISSSRASSARSRCAWRAICRPAPAQLEQALAAVGDFFAGIEIVENRYGDLKELGTPTLVADQMYHCAAVIGDRPETDWRSLDLGALRGRISVEGGSADEGVTSDLLGHPMNGLAWLAGSAEAAAFGGLKAGQVVMLGSVTPPVWLTGPAVVRVAFPPLPGVTLRLV